MASGLDPAAFWVVTPREAMVVLTGADARMEREDRFAQQLAYSSAVLIGTAFHNPKGFPRFGKVFPDPKTRREQTPDEIFSVMSAWADAVPAATLSEPEVS